MNSTDSSSNDESEDERASHEVFTSSKTDEWYTPRGFLEPLIEAVGGFDLDPASGAEESATAAESFTKEEDGLDQPWFGKVWCNPPYSDIAGWSAKFARESYRQDVDLIVALVKDDTSTDWWHENIVGAARYLCFVDHRLKFGGSENSATFGSHVAVYGDAPPELLERLSIEGVVIPTDAILSFNEPEHAQAALGGFVGGGES